MPHIFHDLSVKACLLIDIKFDDPIVIYSLINLRRSKICNFDKFIHNLDVKAFLQDNYISPSDCEGSGFRDKNHQYIVIGDLQIIKMINVGSYSPMALNVEKLAVHMKGPKRA